MNEETKSKLIIYLIVIGFILTLTSVILIIEEIVTAKQFCKEQNQEHKLKFFLSQEHFCDGKLIIRYEDGWDFERPPTDAKDIEISLE